MSTVSADYEDQQTDISLSVRKKVSIVWRYFEKLDRLRVRCRLCRHEQNYQGTTGNILRHLKNKHNIDATLKGQQANPNMASKFVREIEEKSNGRTADEDCSESDFLKIEPTDVSSSSRRVDDIKSKETLGEELDPYTDNTLFYNYVEDPTGNSNVLNIDGNKKLSAQEERIMAEIEYFREKAGYYRMQKNLVALQAKKIKHELKNL
ncbi:uncharacterized protein LOC126750844 [Bactrocera neohumeralis]|uniref:uncharacterized protein LOC120775969 n=1 Tax=Bactrocera tryoni TaxID=59916 RepID=UPI001A974A8B|nr:uncharacterized protein LOC120775969 [Bactrocera tryoni]XP_050316558.1 uncharacterized protein LOC126750844 [Bactrocera neohumeralis]